MAKEMMIVFVYDTLRCLGEADDPADAVLYFHPGWVSDSQRIALCGQLMGVTHCLKALFSTPKVLTLHSGKFVIQEYGRLILAIGSDRNIPDWMLKNRAEILTSFIKVYHCDLQTISAQFPGENSPRFSEKLYQMFETYLPILQFGGYMFQTVPLLDLPKSATNIYLESMQMLEHCQKSKGVLGGTVLFNNKIVATQLQPKLTSHLAMVDPYRIKSPAEAVETEFDLPDGVQMLVIYIKKKHYESLQKDAERIRLWYDNGFEKMKSQKNVKTVTKEPTLGSMKRDKSLLFTAVPEEDLNTVSPTSLSSPSNEKAASSSKPKDSTMPDVVPFSSKPRVRPNKLSLSFKNSISKSIDEDERIVVRPEPVFTGQTSVCSTPMLEFKRLHGNVMSICRASDDKLLSEALNVTSPAKETDVDNAEDAPEVQKPKTVTEKNEDVNDIKTATEHFIPPPMDNYRQYKSMSDINSGFGRISQLAAMRFGKTALKHNHTMMSLNNGDESPNEDLDDKKINVTISDPNYPVFTTDGVPISKSLFDEYLNQLYPKQEDMSKVQIENIPAEHIEGFDSDMMTSPVRRRSCDPELVKSLKLDIDKNHTRRKSLSLPLKPLSGEKTSSSTDKDNQAQSSLFDKKKLTGVQLTPLMEKLSHLAFSEKSSGYSSRGITPMEFKDFALSTPCLEKQITFPTGEKSSRKSIPTTASDSESDSDDDNISSFSIDCIKCVLYVCGLQNTSVIMILEESAVKSSETVQSLYDTVMKNITTIEQLCMEPLPSGDESSDTYSFLSLDPQWGTIKKGGPWAPNDIAMMGYIHKNFKEDPSLTEIIIRSEDSLVFGTAYGGAEVYYQESGSKQPGLPTPADLMGTAPLKSKRRLQRDHSITIF